VLYCEQDLPFGPAAPLSRRIHCRDLIPEQHMNNNPLYHGYDMSGAGNIHSDASERVDELITVSAAGNDVSRLTRPG
jgi:hypothetical protein